MTEQDILNKIKESAESVEIPERLKPEQIEFKLKEKKKPNVFRFQAMHLVAASVALVVLLGLVPLSAGLGYKGAGVDTNGVISGDKQELEQDAIAEIVLEEENENCPATDTTTTVIGEKQDAGNLYVVAKNEQEVYAFLKENAVSENRNYYYGVVDEVAENMLEMIPDGAISEDMKMEAAVESEVAAKQETNSDNASMNSSSQEHSTTNLQMAGVDESDIVKTNGTHIFMVKDNQVKVVEIKDGKMKQVAIIAPEFQSFSDCVLEMYVDNNRLVLVAQHMVDEFGTEKVGNAGLESLPVAETNGICMDVAYNYNVKYSTVLYTYDISNPTKAVLLGTIEQDGAYKTSRKIEDMVYLFTQNTVLLNNQFSEITDEVIAEQMPKVNGENISYDCIYLPEHGVQGLLVSSISTEQPSEVVDNVLIMNDYVDIYVSSSAMYLYHVDYSMASEYTQIAKFSLNKGVISAVAAATVPGIVQDTFAINESDENLRVLTTWWKPEAGGPVNQLYILDKQLNAKGKIEDIAPGETIYAARYFGNLAYFITYRNIDPLFVADLSDINNPKILGELEITGYSEYLHMWGENKLLGIGYETDPKNGSREGVKLVMFDISNPLELSILDTVVLKDMNYSTAMYHYKSVLADSNKNMIGFTATDYDERGIVYYMYSFTDGEFVEELVIEGNNESVWFEDEYRGLWAGNYFYMVHPTGVKSFDYTKDYEAVEELTFKEGSRSSKTPGLEDEWGVILTATSVTSTGLILECAQSGGAPSGELNSGTYYFLEKAEGDSWTAVPTLPQKYEVAWDAVAWMIPKDNVTVWTVDWEWYYGKLPEGTYRIGKEIMDFRGTGDYDKKMYYAEFEVKE